jgi:acyl-CoA synthetase (AMP-forming)/AMP-acid ligase II
VTTPGGPVSSATAAAGGPAPLPVTAWLSAPRSDTGVHLLRDGGWERVGYLELAARVAARTALLAGRGLGGQRLAALTDDGLDFVVSLFAILSAGGTCVPVPPAPMLDRASDYGSRTTQVLRACRVRALLAGPRVPPELSGVPTVELAADPAGPGDSGYPGGPAGPGDPADFADRSGVGPAPADRPALIQFSSGSSGDPRGIRISRRALDAGVQAIATWLGMASGDRTATWLPLHHDMGLIGTVLTPVSRQTDLFLMTPLEFLRSPATWLRCFSELGATLTAAPPFGYAYAARRVGARSLGAGDMSRWRAAIVGAEPIRAGVLDAFAERFAPLGFSRAAFCPAYGMAEATLIVTGVPPGGDAPSLAAPGPAAPPGAAAVAGLAANPLSSSGPPLPGHRVEVRSPAGDAVPEGVAGEVWVSAPSLADGYETFTPPRDDDGGGSDGGGGGAFVDGWLRTGDVGLLRDGHLYVFGRLADSVKIRGEWVLAEQAEASLERILPPGRSAVVVPSRRAGAGVTVIVESAGAPGELPDATGAALAAVFDGIEVDVVTARRGSVPRTTSGKPRRRACWERFVAADAAPPG